MIFMIAFFLFCYEEDMLQMERIRWNIYKKKTNTNSHTHTHTNETIEFHFSIASICEIKFFTSKEPPIVTRFRYQFKWKSVWVLEKNSISQLESIIPSENGRVLFLIKPFSRCELFFTGTMWFYLELVLFQILRCEEFHFTWTVNFPNIQYMLIVKL